MKTETEIAEENTTLMKICVRTRCKTHLSTLRRWLDFLCCLYKEETANVDINNRKIKDIKKAIKTYEDVGIE